MNVVLPINSSGEALSALHSISAYDQQTNELVSEIVIPRFLDPLAVKIVEVGEDDPEAVLSYELTARQVQIFTFLLGLPTDNRISYFLEPTDQNRVTYPPRKAEAVFAFERFSARSIQRRKTDRRITESELTVPTLRFLEDSPKRAFVKTGELMALLADLFRPTGEDASILAGRSDTYFSQKVRNMISHREQPSSFIRNGLADYRKEERGLRITRLGLDLVSALRL